VTSRSGQIALEYLVYLGVTMFLFLIIALASLSHIRDVEQERRLNAIQDFAAGIQYQLVVLSSLDEGLTFNIQLPTKIESIYEYSIVTNSGYLIVTAEEDEIVLRIPKTSGQFVAGANQVTLQGGTLYID